MRIIPFFGRLDPGPDDGFLLELEAALDGDRVGLPADSWRLLRDDVRALSPPPAPEFERRVRSRMADLRGPRARGASRPGSPAAGPSALPAPPAGSVPARPALPDSAAVRLRRRLPWRRPPGRLGAAAGVAAMAVVAAAVLVAGPFGAAPVPVEKLPHSTGGSSGAVVGVQAPAVASGAVASGAASVPGPRTHNGVFRNIPPASGAASASGGAVSAAPALGGLVPAPGRLQQRAASITLSAAPSEVQTVADAVSRLAVGFGGFVSSAQVGVSKEGGGRAELALRLPAAKLGGALSALGQLAPMLAESQSLQDVTGAYDAARGRLSDAVAERQALFRALAAATSEGQIDSLRERIASARSSIGKASSELHSVSRRAASAEVEVVVVGAAAAASASGEGLTVHRGLHDAERVLVAAFVVLLVAAAVLVPLALLLGALALAGRAWRRYRRERLLDAG
jgi:Domain of unknown function (DUF4349)